MALRIFETDPEAFARQGFADDVVGRFRSGTMQGKTPVSLSQWRVTTGDPEVASYVAQSLGGDVTEWETDNEDRLQVMTTSQDVAISIAGPEAISSCLTLWGQRTIIHQCNGVEFISGDAAGEKCGCPERMKARKELAKTGRGPKPDIRVTFRLAENPDLGKFSFMTGSWDMAAALPDVERELVMAGGPATARLVLELVEYTTKTGIDVRYHKPVIKGIAPDRSAVARAAIEECRALGDEAPF